MSSPATPSIAGDHLETAHGHRRHGLAGDDLDLVPTERTARQRNRQRDRHRPDLDDRRLTGGRPDAEFRPGRQRHAVRERLEAKLRRFGRGREGDRRIHDRTVKIGRDERPRRLGVEPLDLGDDLGDEPHRVGEAVREEEPRDAIDAAVELGPPFRRQIPPVERLFEQEVRPAEVGPLRSRSRRLRGRCRPRGSRVRDRRRCLEQNRREHERDHASPPAAIFPLLIVERAPSARSRAFAWSTIGFGYDFPSETPAFASVGAGAVHGACTNFVGSFASYGTHRRM